MRSTSQRFVSRSARAILASFALLASASAQCTTWQPGLARPALSESGRALAVFDGGAGPELVIGGQFGLGGPVPNFQRITKWNGSAWSSLAAGLGGTVRALCVFDAGNGPRLYAGGEIANQFVQRWDGSAWSALGAGVNGTVTCMTVYDDGHGPALYVGGEFNLAGGVVRPRIARFDGTQWSSVGAGLPGVEVLALAAHDDGMGLALFAGTSAGIARFDGSAWNASFASASAPVRALASFGGALYVGGDFTTLAGDANLSHVARWNGSTWSALGAGTDGNVNAFCIHDDGAGARLFVAGSFAHAGGLASTAVARFDGAQWSRTASGIVGTANALFPYDDGSGVKLFATGNCALVGGTQALNIVRWDGVRWSAISAGFAGAVNAVECFDDGSGAHIYAAAGSSADVGGLPATPVVRWNGSSWDSIPDGVGGPVGQAMTLRTSTFGGAPRLIAGGTFTNVAGASNVHVAAFDGASWQPIGGNVGGAVRALAEFDFGAGRELVAAGSMPGFAAHFDGHSWAPLPGLTAISPIGGDPFGVAYALAVVDTGSGPQLFVGGYFGVSADGAYSLARWNGTHWVGVGSVTHTSWGAGDLEALETFDDGSGPALYIAGRFQAVGGQALSSLARWNGNAWSSVGAYPHAGANDVTHGLALADLGAGEGTELVCFPADGDPWVAWNGHTWSTVAHVSGSGFTTRATTLRGVGVATPELWCAGSFYAIEGVSSQGVAHAQLCLETGRIVCLGDGLGTSCPCGNSSATSARAGCLNSSGVGATLRARGAASVSQDSLSIRASDLAGSGAALLFQGTSLVSNGAGSVFGDGLRCVGGNVRRLVTRNATNGAPAFGPEFGDAPLHVLGAVRSSSARRGYQLWYRNASNFCTPSTFNLTNALEIVWEP